MGGVDPLNGSKARIRPTSLVAGSSPSLPTVTTSIRSTGVTLGVAAALLVSACGGSSSETSPSDPTPTTTESAPSSAADPTPTEPETTTTGRPPTRIDACDLVDTDAATAILGGPAEIDDLGANAGIGSVCSWVTPTDALLTVTLFEGREFYGGNAIPGTEVLDIADEGVISVEDNFGGVIVEFVKGDAVVSLSVTPFGVEDVASLPDAVVAAARDAAARLP